MAPARDPAKIGGGEAADGVDESGGMDSVDTVDIIREWAGTDEAEEYEAKNSAKRIEEKKKREESKRAAA